MSFRDPRLGRMAAFLGSIGIEMRAGAAGVATLFPGSLIDRGSLVVDESKLVAPGDALHEAAHIALAPPERRGADMAFLDDATGGEELTTIAWCWAALLEIDVAPEDIYHGTAYPRGDSTMPSAERSGGSGSGTGAGRSRGGVLPGAPPLLGGHGMRRQYRRRREQERKL